MEGDRKAADMCDQDFLGIQFAVVWKAEEEIGGYYDERKTRWMRLAVSEALFQRTQKTTETLPACYVPALSNRHADISLKCLYKSVLRNCSIHLVSCKNIFLNVTFQNQSAHYILGHIKFAQILYAGSSFCRFLASIHKRLNVHGSVSSAWSDTKCPWNGSN
jgi:hypothetical protein